MRWRFDETAGAGSEHLDPAYVATYDEKSGTDWSEEIETLLANGIDASSTVVDLGAGTGSFAAAIAPHVRRVVPVDPSPAMIAAIRSHGLDAVEAGFLTYEHIGDRADAVFTRNALHHLPDFWKAVALGRISAMLRAGGILLLHDLVYSFEPSEAGAVLEPWFAAAPSDPADGWTGDELAEHVRTEHSTYTWLLEPMLEHAGFEIRDRWTSDSQVYAEYLCVRR